MKKYLILGGNGFLGRYIIERLAPENKIIVADRAFNSIKQNKNITFEYLDYTTCKDFSHLLNGVDIVIHLISTIVANDELSNINQEISDNIFPTIRILDDMVKNDVKKILFISSGGTIYGEHSKKPISEIEEKRPICNYGIVKETIEKYLHLYNHHYDIDYNIVRLANPYSDVTKNGRNQGIIPIFTDKVLSNETIKIWGDGNDIRDYIYIDDAIDAIITVLNYQGNEKIFNIGTGVGYSINEVLSIICHNLKIDINSIDIEYEKERKCDVKNNVLNIEKISSLTGWKPKVSLEEGIKIVINNKINGSKKNENKIKTRRI